LKYNNHPDLFIERCSREKYREFLTVVNNAFGHQAEDEWVENDTPNCTPLEKDARDSEIEKHFIASVDGKIVGTIGAYAFDWLVSDGETVITIEAFGTGQVCTREDFRGRGVMSALMKHALKEMTNAGKVISFLTGDRFRYQHFGYDLGGNTAKFSLSKNHFGKSIELLNIDSRAARPADWRKLNSLYETLPSYLKRDELAWKRHLERYNFSFIIGEHKGKTGYICVKDENECVEAAGDRAVVLNLIHALIQREKLDEVRVHYPYMSGLPDELSEALYRAASSAEVSPYGMIAIHNADILFDQMSAIIEKQINAKVAGIDTYQKELILRRLFGYVYHPLKQPAAGFSAVHPLCAWMPPVDTI